MRGISIQAMVEGTARARVKRALTTKTRPAGQSHDYKNGDLVDFHRAPFTKNASGWRGPANIIDNTNITRGTLTVTYQRDMPIEVRLQDVRRHLDYFCFMAAKSSPLDAGLAEWAKIRTLVDEQPPGKLAQLGMMFKSRGWQATANVSQTLDTTLPWRLRFASIVLQLAKCSRCCLWKRTGSQPSDERLCHGPTDVVERTTGPYLL
jgi:hypothetical protein